MLLFFFTAFAGGLSAVSNVPGFNYGPGYTSFIFAFVLCQSAAFGGVFSGFSIAADFQFGFGRRLLLATPHRSALILGYGIVALFRATITIGVVTLVGLAVGMNIDGGGLDVFGMYALAAIINITGLLFAAGVALRFRSLQATPLMQVPGLPLPLPGSGLRAARAARRLGARGRAVQPGHPRDGDGPRPGRRDQGSEYLATLGGGRRAARRWCTVFAFTRPAPVPRPRASGHPPSSPLRAVISKQLLRMESSGLGSPPSRIGAKPGRPSCILTCGKDPNSLNPSIPNAGDVKDRKGNHSISGSQKSGRSRQLPPAGSMFSRAGVAIRRSPATCPEYRRPSFSMPGDLA